MEVQELPSVEHDVRGHIFDTFWITSTETLARQPQSDQPGSVDVYSGFGAFEVGFALVNNDKSSPLKKGRRFAFITSHATGR